MKNMKIEDKKSAFNDENFLWNLHLCKDPELLSNYCNEIPSFCWCSFLNQGVNNSLFD
jgi:hypothetical protein